MITLSTLAALLHAPMPPGFADRPLTSIACRPVDLQAGGLYCVVDEYLDYGHWVAGRDWLPQLPPGMAGAILADTPLPHRPEPVVVVANARQAMATAARMVLEQPDNSLRVIGITGTKGKTTTSHLVRQWLTLLGTPCAALGTLGLHLSDHQVVETTYTTPLATDLFRWLAEIRRAGLQAVAMEISSHAIKLERCHGLQLAVAVFTNLTRDHLDFHKTWEDYRDTKRSLFTGLPEQVPAVVNLEDPLGREIQSLHPARFMGYGTRPEAQLRASHLEQTARGMRFQVHYQGHTAPLTAPLLGRFNLDNLLAAMGVCLTLGASLDDLAASATALQGVPGRMELIPLPGGRIGVVDFAHTPDSLEKILQTLRAMAGEQKIVTVFGCGGDRDRGKRPLMGAVAASLSDLCVVTSDNPRSEDPEAILAEILAAMPRGGVQARVDRHQAIQLAYELTKPGDILLLAGKGHETRQIFKDHTVPFSDRQELESLA